MFNNILAIDMDRVPDFLARAHALSANPPIQMKKADLAQIPTETLKHIDALLVSIYEEIDEKFLSALPSLRYVGVLGTSLKKIDHVYCKKNGILVSPVKEYCDDETAEWVILQILKFFREGPVKRSVFEKSLGIIGFGSVGKKLGIKAQGLGMKVFANTHSSSVLPFLEASKEYIFAHSDVISFHTPPHSSWLLKEQLKHVKTGALIINTCLGPVDKGDALWAFLQERPDVHLVLDQIAYESYKDLPKNAYYSLEKAFETVDSEKRLWDIFFEQAARVS